LAYPSNVAGTPYVNMAFIAALRVVVSAAVENHPGIGRVRWQDRVYKLMRFARLLSLKRAPPAPARFDACRFAQSSKRAYSPTSDCNVVVCLTGFGLRQPSGALAMFKAVKARRALAQSKPSVG